MRTSPQSLRPPRPFSFRLPRSQVVADVPVELCLLTRLFLFQLLLRRLGFSHPGGLVRIGLLPPVRLPGETQSFTPPELLFAGLSLLSQPLSLFALQLEARARRWAVRHPH
ncbi:hypothetical protein PG996_003351 [Apiospora saccharicola]|uniref:Uncharacterized protein n=1 Tax=Apiospora saccharicola TaxID=335842 RepID=A0ABR1W3M3_9PEZI